MTDKNYSLYLYKENFPLFAVKNHKILELRKEGEWKPYQGGNINAIRTLEKKGTFLGSIDNMDNFKKEYPEYLI